MMEMMIKVFLMIYLLAIILLTIFSAICILTMIFKPDWVSTNTFSAKHYYQKIKYLN